MPIQAIFGLGVLLSFVAVGIVAKLYIVPKLRAKHRKTPFGVHHARGLW